MEDLLKEEALLLEKEMKNNAELNNLGIEKIRIIKAKENLLNKKIQFLLKKNKCVLPITEWDDNEDEVVLKEEGKAFFKSEEDMLLLIDLLNQRKNVYCYEVYTGSFKGAGKYKISFELEYRCGYTDHVFTFRKIK